MMTLSVKPLGSFWHSDILLLNEIFFHFMNLLIHRLLALNSFPAMFSDCTTSHASKCSVAFHEIQRCYCSVLPPSI
jgi:hypothetical protein